METKTKVDKLEVNRRLKDNPTIVVCILLLRRGDFIAYES